MLKNQNGKGSSSGSSSGSGSRLFQNLKRFANSGSSSSASGQITTDMISSPRAMPSTSPVNNAARNASSPARPTRDMTGMELHQQVRPSVSSQGHSVGMVHSSSQDSRQPLSKNSSLNTQNLGQYINKTATSPDLMSNASTSGSASASHRRNMSVQSSSKYSYSRRSSQLSSLDPSRLSHVQTNQSSSAASILSQGSFVNLAKFVTPDGKVHLEMPSDPAEVETLFEDIMLKRNILQNLPEAKRNELMGYDIKKKWLIVKQDLQNEIKRMKSKNSMKSSGEALDIGGPDSTYTPYSGSIHTSTSHSSVVSPGGPGGSMPGNQQMAANPRLTKIRTGATAKPGQEQVMYRQTDRNVSASSVTSDKTNRPPIYYVKKILAEQLSVDEINDLWVTLRTEQLDWVDAFLEHQGHIAMANSLMNTIYRTTPSGEISNELLDKENAFFKCFRVLIMLRQGLYEFTTHTLMCDTIARGLFSTKLNTKKMATEIFVVILQKKDATRFNMVLQALDQNFKIGQNFHMKMYYSHYPQYFSHLTIDSQLKVIQAWRFAVEQTLDGRGKMGSRVGASDEFKASGGENTILEYCLWTMILINHICTGSESIEQRMHLRTKLENSGFVRVINRFKLFDYDKIMEEIDSYENSKLDDFNSALEKNNNNTDVNLQDPMSLLGTLWASCKGTDNEKTLVSLMQHIFLSSSRLIENKADPTQLAKQLKLMDSLVTNISASSADEESTMNMAIQRLYDSMQTDEVARRAILESRTLTKRLEEVEAERDVLSEKLGKAEHGLVGQLQNELQERERILVKSQRVTLQLENELEELKKKHLLEKHDQEVELRKMLTILNSRPELQMSSRHKGSKSEVGGTISKDIFNEKKQRDIQKALQDGLRRTNKDYASDSKKFGMTVQPNKRLKVLRNQMESLENEARQLEMTNFADYEKKKLEPPANVTKKHKHRVPKSMPRSKLPSLDKKKKKDENDAQIKKLNELRETLAQIQSESNDISKFNVEERVNELFNDKKMLALQRLKELETKYKDFGIDFNIEEILGPSAGLLTEPATDTQDKNEKHPSLDPTIYEDQLDEINRITEELIQMRNKLDKERETKTEHNDDTSSTSSSSSSSSDSESLNENNNDRYSQVSERSTGSGSFFESLTQKYATGTKEPIHRATMNEKSFMNRVRKSSVPAPYLQELNQRVGTTPAIDETESGAASSDSDSDEASKYNKTFELANNDSDSNDVEDEENKTLDAKDNEDDGLEDNDDGEKSAVPPPPPPPPLPPNGLFNIDSANGTDKSVSTTGAPPPPPPPPPPPMPMSKSSSTTSMTPPPPPPAPPIPTPGSLKHDMSSPLLTQSPSLFERYPRPQKKLKQLHWEKIEPADNSVWNASKAERFADDLYEKGVLANLERAFAAREVKSLASKKKEDLDKISFLSRDISQQFGINLHMFSSLTVEELILKVLKCDRDFLGSPSVIEFLSKPEIIEVSINLAKNYAPYTTDWEGVKHVEDAKPPEKDPNELQRADQVYLQLMVNLQSYWGSRMRALTVVTTFEKEYSELLVKLRKVDKAVGSLQDSENIHNVFNVILAVGNYMNDTSKQAQGFKLTTLQRLTFIKDYNNSMTFLNYVEKIVRLNYPSFNDFLKELEPLTDVVKVSVDQLINDCRSFTQSIINVERSVEIGNLSDSSKFHPQDRVLAKVLPVLQEARKKADLLENEVKLTMLEFSGLMQVYGEDSSDKFAKNSFFRKFVDFINEYKRAQEQNIKSEEEEKLYEKHKKMVEDQQRKQQEEDEKRKKHSEGSGNGDGDDVADEEDDRRAVMDKLLEQLKNAGPKKADPTSARKRALVRKKVTEDLDQTETSQDLETDEESLVYSPDISNMVKTPLGVNSPSSAFSSANKHSVSPSKHSRLRSINRSINEEEGEDEEEEEIQDRATALLMELRGSSGPLTASSPKKGSALDERKERLRARRLKSSNASSADVGTKLKFFDSHQATTTESNLPDKKTEASSEVQEKTGDQAAANNESDEDKEKTSDSPGDETFTDAESKEGTETPQQQ